MGKDEENVRKMPGSHWLPGVFYVMIIKMTKPLENERFYRWQPKKDSNPHKQSQSLSCYHYTIRLYLVFLSN